MTLDKFEEPVLYKIGDNRTLSESDKMADFGTQPCLNCTVPEGENGQNSVFRSDNIAASPSYKQAKPQT